MYKNLKLGHEFGQDGRLRNGIISWLDYLVCCSGKCPNKNKKQFLIPLLQQGRNDISLVVGTVQVESSLSLVNRHYFRCKHYIVHENMFVS